MQSEVQKILEQAVNDGSESGVQVAVYLNGELIVDAWASPVKLPVDGRTLFPFFSTGKGIAATAIHRLVERGVLSWNDPLAQYWPEFAAKGKDGILLRHALNHTAGLPMMPESCESITWDAMCDFFATTEPLHPPGAQRYYHAISYSWLLGETASRADGRAFGRIIAEEVCQPLGIDTLFFGVPTEMRPLCVDAEKPLNPSSPDPASQQPPDPVAQRSIPSWVCPLEDWINREDVRSACIPASNGFGNARAIARHYAALIGNGVDGVRLLSEETVAEATRWDPTSDGAIPGGGQWGLGYALQGPDNAPGIVFGHGGYGGSTGFADLRSGLAIGIVKSRMAGPLTTQLLETINRYADASSLLSR